MSLKKEAGKGIIWVAAERFGQQLIQIVIFIVLARLLSPTEFGLVAMVMIVFEVSQSFIDSGMGQALIRERSITDIDRSTVFWLNILLSGLFYILIYFTATLVADFYDQPDLILLIRVMGLSVFSSGLSIVQRAEMTQRMEFKKQAIAQIPAVLVAGIVSILLAYFGAGVWSLVAQYLLVSMIGAIVLWKVNPIRIRFIFNISAFKRLFGFGYKLLLSGLLATIFNNIYKLVIGKLYAASTLGLYTQAKKIKDLASLNLISVIQKVTYPLLAKTRDNPDRLRVAYRQIILVSSYVIVPLMVFLIVFAAPIMEYVLGPQWIEATSFLQLICISGALFHLHSINLNLLKVYGRSDLFLKLEVYKKIIISIALLIGVQFGIYGVLIGQVISSYISLFINTYYTSKFLKYSVFQQVFDVLKVGLFSFPMAVVLLAGVFFFSVNSLAALIAYIGLGFLVYVLTSLYFRGESFNYILSIAQPYIPIKLKFFLKI
ncbi:MAG: lipopolysaccharide biosynthesis protein [Lunatimonas sp.]|uniref:lipopolysaccharide biosynthesis protein n=1 Tax=Lunatimonas sp. TaxID=2060141 RepID=UPI00263A4538|nr:lipopolysaccharide biosynthesis protein [Lunatimonas sp.]MCC5937202.1 lipopolysaccharide biosynthesis protein [Lunatimonas sp.]